MEPATPHATALSPTVLTLESRRHVELLVDLAAPGPRRPPRTIVLLLDASQAELVAAARALGAFTDTLAAEDRVAIVATGREAWLAHPLDAVGDGAALHRSLGAIEKSPFANLSSGLARALAEARRQRERRWTAAWDDATEDDGSPGPGLTKILRPLGGPDRETPADPGRARDLLGLLPPGDAALERLVRAALPVELLVVSDGDPGRGVADPYVLRAMAARGRAHGVRTGTTPTQVDNDGWVDRLRAVAEGGGGRFVVGDCGSTIEHDVAVLGSTDAEPLAAQAVSAVLRPTGVVEEVESAGRHARNVGRDEHVFDLGDLVHGETKRLALRLRVDEALLPGRGRRREPGPRAGAPHRPRIVGHSGPAGDGSADGAALRVAPVALGTIEIEWFVAADGRSEGVRLPLHLGVPADGSWTPPPAHAWSEALPELTLFETDPDDDGELEEDEDGLDELEAVERIAAELDAAEVDPASLRESHG